MKKIILFVIAIVLVTSIYFFLSKSSEAGLIIIDEVTTYDLNKDGENDKVNIFVKDDKLILQVNKEQVDILELPLYIEDVAAGHVPDYEITYHIVEDKVLIGVTYTRVNKFGHASDLYCYQYDQELHYIWDNTLINNEALEIVSYDKEGFGYASVHKEEKKFVVDEIGLEEFNRYIDHLKNEYDVLPFMEFRVIKDHQCKDIDGDGKEELLIEHHVLCGASSYQDDYITVLEFDDNMTIVDGWFKSSVNE